MGRCVLCVLAATCTALACGFVNSQVRAQPAPLHLAVARGDVEAVRKLIVADGLRAMTYQELYLPLVPTDAASDGERLFLLGSAQGALAIYVNRIDTARLPRRLDRRVWDTDADRRSGYHR